MWHHRVETPAHSRVMHPGDPPEWVTLAHRDGSFSEVCISAENDTMTLDMYAALTHPPHLTGM